MNLAQLPCSSHFCPSPTPRLGKKLAFLAPGVKFVATGVWKGRVLPLTAPGQRHTRSSYVFPSEMPLVGTVPSTGPGGTGRWRRAQPARAGAPRPQPAGNTCRPDWKAPFGQTRPASARVSVLPTLCCADSFPFFLLSQYFFFSPFFFSFLIFSLSLSFFFPFCLLSFLFFLFIFFSPSFFLSLPLPASISLQHQQNNSGKGRQRGRLDQASLPPAIVLKQCCPFPKRLPWRRSLPPGFNLTLLPQILPLP